MGLSLGMEEVGRWGRDLSRELLLLLPRVDRSVDWLLSVLLRWGDGSLLLLSLLRLVRHHTRILHQVDIAEIDSRIGGGINRHTKRKQRFELLGE